MLENGLFFALGFLGAALFALLIAPAIWRRAVTLTRKRIEETVPLTLNEFQAEKDHLRAEFAMSATRLEASNEKLKETAAEQLVEINRKKTEILDLTDRLGERDVRISELENHNTELRAQADQLEEEFNAAKTKLVSTEMSLEQKTAALEEIENRYSSAVDEFDGQKIEMVARETRMDTIKDEFTEIKKSKKDAEAENSRLLKELKTATSGLTKQKTRNDELEEKLSALQSGYADMEGRLERRDADLERLRNKSGSKASEKSSQSEDEQRQENALMRERISELAAMVTRATADAEGKDSPIHKALAKPPKKTGQKAGKKPNTRGKTKKSPPSLAERIKTKKPTAEKA